MVPVVDTVAVREQLARTNDVVELRHAVLRVVAAAPVHVAIEDAGVAIRTEEDEGVRERLEPRRHPVLERLADLRVVLLSAGPWIQQNVRCPRGCWVSAEIFTSTAPAHSHSIDRTRLDERAVKDLAQVVVLLGVAGLLEVA